MKPISLHTADFRKFVWQPAYIWPQDGTLSQRKQETAGLLRSELPLFLSITALTIVLLLLVSYLTGQQVGWLLTRSHSNPLAIVITVCVLVPLVSETIFRSVLKITPGRLANLVAFLLLLLLGNYYNDIKAIAHVYTGLWLFLLWVGLAHVVRQFLKRPRVFAQVELFWRVNFRGIFYALVVAYALFWADGILSLTTTKGFGLIVLLALGILLGTYLGYIRMKYGFWAAVRAHILMMSLPMGFELIRFLYF